MREAAAIATVKALDVNGPEPGIHPPSFERMEYPAFCTLNSRTLCSFSSVLRTFWTSLSLAFCSRCTVLSVSARRSVPARLPDTRP